MTADGVAGAPGGLVDRLVAIGYGLTYDAVVRGFPPYEALVADILAGLERARPPDVPRETTRVLDVACGTGIVAARLAAAGYRVTAFEPVARLARVAARRLAGTAVTVRAGDVAAGEGADGAFDAVLSMHTLSWHPDPAALLAGCRRVLRPGGTGVVLTYRRPAGWARVAEVRADKGLGAAFGSLRWLGPTALFEALRSGRRRYLDIEEFRFILTDAGFAILDVQQTFLAGMSLLAWVRRP